MKMKLMRQVQVIKSFSVSSFERELTELFNDPNLRIIDIQYRTESNSGQLCYIAFIIYEYSLPDDEENSNESKQN